MKNFALMGIIAAVMSLMATSASAFCFKEAGEFYGTNPLVLYAIAKQESGFRSAIYNRNNSDGSYDIGLMQINSSWLGVLSRYGISESDLVKNPCLNVYVGAWLLSNNMSRYVKDREGFWSAVGAYNAGTSKKNHHKRMNYAWLIYNHMAAIK